MVRQYFAKSREYFERKAKRKLTDAEWQFIEYLEFVKSCGDNFGSIEQIAKKYHNGSVGGAKVKLRSLIRKGFAIPYNIRGFQR